MSRAYFTEDQKLAKLTHPPRWTISEQTIIEETLFDKGYFVNTVSRIACDCKWHDALQVKREDMPQLIEELFRQRLTFEVQAEGKYNASIIFCYDDHATTVISAVKRFRKNKRNGGKL